jgi:ABC-2 type transport system ATP-binding protein
LNALEIKGLTKTYPGFTLDNVTFNVPAGSIVGFVGENGAGKSTTLNAALGIIKSETGEVNFFGGQKISNREVRENIGVVLDSGGFPDVLRPMDLHKVLSKIYTSWDKDKFYLYLNQFKLPADKRIKQFSRGMKMKLSIAAAMSHNAKLLILDEATGGLDPIVRDEILDMFLDFVQDEERAILTSSHITADLEKAADYIVFIHEGRVVFDKPKDELKYKYGIIKCGKAVFDSLEPDDVIAWRKQDYEWQALTADKEKALRKYPKAVVDAAAIDEIMLMYVKGEVK